MRSMFMNDAFADTVKKKIYKVNQNIEIKTYKQKLVITRLRFPKEMNQNEEFLIQHDVLLNLV